MGLNPSFPHAAAYVRGLKPTLSITGWLKTAVVTLLVLSLVWLGTNSLVWLGTKEYLNANPCADGAVLNLLMAQIPAEGDSHGVVIWNISMAGGHAWEKSFSCKGEVTGLRALSDLSSEPRQSISYQVSSSPHPLTVKLLSIQPEDR